MTRQIVLRQALSNRRQPLLISQTSTGSVRIAEVAGGTAAECAAVCCCCPCGLINLLFLVAYKIPAGLCRRALRRRQRQRRIAKGQLQPPPPPRRRLRCSCGCDDSELHVHPAVADGVNAGKSEESEQEARALEKEMWDRFYGTGFGRSHSQREQFVNATISTN